MSSNGISIVTTTWKERENIQKLIPIIKDVLEIFDTGIRKIESDLSIVGNWVAELKAKAPNMKDV